LQGYEGRLIKRMSGERWEKGLKKVKLEGEGAKGSRHQVNWRLCPRREPISTPAPCNRFTGAHHAGDVSYDTSGVPVAALARTHDQRLLTLSKTALTPTHAP
jgi:hypothetical protein